MPSINHVPNRPRHSRRLAAGLVGLVALSLAACSPPSSNTSGGAGNGAESGSEPKVLNVIQQAGAGTLDPALANQAMQWYLDLAYSPLIQRSTVDGYRPALATSWGYVGEGNMAFELTLREGVVFADGSPLTAQAVVDHMNYVKEAGGQASTLMGDFGAVTAPDQMTVRIDLVSPNPLMEYLLSQSGFGITQIISPKGLQDPEALGSQTFGAGPYILDTSRTVRDDTYVYTPNPTYWDPDGQYWDEVVIKVIPNINSVLNAMIAGQGDITQGDYSTADLAKDAGLHVKFVPNVFQGLSLMDRDGAIVPALGDVRVRQAINYALDREAITEALLGEYGVPTTQTLTGEGFQPELDNYYAYDLDKAKALMAEAGYADGFDLPVVSTPFFNGDAIVQAIAGQLAEIGVNVQIDSKADANDYVTAMASGEFPASLIGYGTQPMFIEGPGLFLPGALFNPFHTEDAQISEWYAELAVASDADRVGICEQIETRLVELAWFAQTTWVPLGTYSSAKIDTAAIDATTGDNPIVGIVELKPAGV
ncbi:MAG: ABC transporter substrate-binding protein [Bifidobacteriaceae bacterium]|jgi:peptide/nickel transport system substrate-binding protein|nr:ABC transporter substrate-binding protein [Bifidobacteriaceae bacterium]